MKRQTHWPKYLLVFFATALVFSAAWYASFAANREKLNHLQEAQDKVATDILSSETQFDLLQEASCDDMQASTLGDEIASLANKINYGEQNLTNTEEILALKKQYSILQIKDFLLAKRVGAKCNHAPVSIFYFYGTKESCPDCTKQGYVLDAIRAKYPSVRIYAFDYNLDLSTIKAMRKVYKVGEMLPAVVINGTVTKNGYQTFEEIARLLPSNSSSKQ